MICVECGAEVDELHQGMCLDCYVDKKVKIDIEDPIEIEICSKCGSIRKGDKWLERPDLETVMLDRIEDSLTIPSSVDKFSFQVELDEGDPKNIKADLTVELSVKGKEIEKYLSTNLVLKKAQCKNCSKREGDYYEAILQVRPTKTEMTQEQKHKVFKMVHERVEVEKGDEKKVFITLEKEIHGGLDFYLSDRRVTRNLSYDVADLFGGDVKESSELAGREDGQNVYRMTYSVRLPPYEAGDFIKFEDKVYRIKKTKRGSGPVLVQDLEENRGTTISKEEIRAAEVYGGEELVKKAVVVSEKNEEIQIMDPETYETKTLLKPDGFRGEKDQVEVVKIESRLYLLPENSN